MSNMTSRLQIAIMLLFFSFPAFSVTTPSNFIYEGIITNTSGNSVDLSAGISAQYAIISSGGCYLYSETSIETSQTGQINHVIGSGTINYNNGGANTLIGVLTATGTLNGVVTLPSGSGCSATAAEPRSLVVSLQTSPAIIATIAIQSVPYALQAGQVSGYGTANLAKISGSGSANIFSPFQHDFLFNLSAAGSASSTPCVTGEILKFNGTSWACGADNTGGAPGDASYAAKGTVQFNTDAATSGVSVSSGVATINTGFGANQIPKYDASANLGLGISPTSKLDVNGSITQRGMAAPALTAAGTGRIYFDSTSNKFRVSENTGAYVDLVSGASSLSGDVSGTTSTTSVDKIKGTALSITSLTSGNFLKYNGTNWVNTNIAASDITAGILGVANGGTGASTIGSGNIVIGAGTGAVTSLASGASGNVVYGTGLTSWTSGTPDTAGLVDKSSVQSISGAKTFGATVKMSNQNLLSLGDTGSNAVSLRAPTTVTSNYTLTMPAALPGSNQVLQSNSSGVLSWVTAGTGDALTTNPLSQFAATTSSQLSGVLSDETGTGLAVFNTSPTFATNITSPMLTGGTSTTSSLTYKTTSGVGATGADHIFQVGTNGATEAMRILNSGLVGIGTSTPGRMLHVAATQSTGATIILENTSRATDQKKRYINSGNDGSGTMSFGKFNDSLIATSHMTINDIGNVGIGTTMPAFLLDVEGINSSSASNGSAAYAQLTVSPTVTSSTYNTATQSIADYTGSSTTGTPSAYANLVGVLGIGKVSGTGLVFSTAGVWGTTTSTSATISNGIGVYGDIQTPATGGFTSATGIFGNVSQASGPIVNAYGGQFQVNGSPTNAFGIKIGTVSALSTKYSLFSSDSAAPSYFAANVGIGTTSALAKLDITDTSTTTSAIVVPRAGTFTGTSVNGMIRYNTVSNLFEFRQNGAWTNYTTVSDERLKTNITPIANGLNIVNQLNPVFYDWDQNNPRTASFDKNHEVGFIAQEVEKVLPEVVNIGEDSYRSLEYGKIVSVVVAAVKEMSQKILGIQSEVTKINEKIASQNREIASMKEHLDQLRNENIEFRKQLQKMNEKIGAQ